MTRYLSGRRGRLQGDGGVVWRLWFGVGLGLSVGVGPEVGQRQGDVSDVVDPEQNLQGADVLEALIRQSLTRLLNLLNARGERAQPTPWREREREREVEGEGEGEREGGRERERERERGGGGERGREM